MQELEAENERLRQLLSYVEENASYSYITARVVTKDPGYYFDAFVINAGYNDGVAVDDAVITADGLVGRVIETGGTYSVVMAIIDARSSVSGTVERTRDNGVVNGVAQPDSTGSLCEMVFLPLEAELLPGDRVISNGLGGIYPSGFLIGTVVEVSSTTTTSGLTVKIEPAVDFLHLEEVMIVKQADQAGGRFPMRRLTIFGMLLLAVSVDCSVWTKIDLWGLNLSLTLCVVVNLSVVYGKFSGALAGMAAGLIMDGLVSPAPGFYAVANMLTRLCGRRGV